MTHTISPARAAALQRAIERYRVSAETPPIFSAVEMRDAAWAAYQANASLDPDGTPCGSASGLAHWRDWEAFCRGRIAD